MEQTEKNTENDNEKNKMRNMEQGSRLSKTNIQMERRKTTRVFGQKDIQHQDLKRQEYIV